MTSDVGPAPVQAAPRVGRAPGGVAARIALTVVWLALAVFLLGLRSYGSGSNPWVNSWPGKVTAAMPALVCLAAIRGAGVRRAEVLAVGLGAASWLLGGLLTAVATAGGATLPYPSVADIGYLGFFPFMVAAVVLVLRREGSGQQHAVWIDSLIGGLGAATGLAVMLDSALKQAPGGVWAAAVSVAYPLGDLLLVAAVISAMAVRGSPVRDRWLWFAGGLVLFAVADVVYALRVAHHAYHLGTPLDALWSLGLTMLAMWSWQAGTPEPAPPVTVPVRTAGDRTGSGLVHRGRPGRAAPVVPALASGTALTVLLIGSRVHLGLVVLVLAGATLCVAATRTQLAQALRLADARRQALTDDLTGLGNRRALYSHLRSRLDSHSPPRTAVLLVDLDHFREINDTLGHQAGDQMLQLVGPRLASLVRQGDLLVRTGGDDFALVLTEGIAGAVAVARRVTARLQEPFVLDGVGLRIGVSVGIALCPDHAVDADGLLQRADVALYAAKRRGGGTSIYDPRTDLHSRDRLRMAEELIDALDREQLRLHYQPQCDVATGAVVGIEALVRWQHPRHGLLAPDLFLPLVEQRRLMGRLTAWVLREALHQCRSWRTDGLDFRVSVNLSASDLLDERLPDQVAELIARTGVPAGSLTLELTESMLMADPERCRHTLGRLSLLGVDLSVDDYGTGFSSLAYLHDLPVDELKLDRSFLSDLADPRSAAIVRSTVGLAHSLGLRLVAEGVEDEPTLRALRDYGCDVAQGFYLSRPLPPDELTSWLGNRPATRTPVGQAAARS